MRSRSPSALKDSQPPPRPARQGLFLAALLLLWASFIFATSCTVVRPQDFFDWIHRHLFQSDSFFASFQAFWGLSWFTIVKGWHAIEFAILLLFLVAVVDWLTGRRAARNVAVGVVLCVVFAVSDEWHQTFVPDRGGTVTDVFIDSLGVLVAASFLLHRLKRRPGNPR